MRLTSEKLVRELALDPGGMVQEALLDLCVVAERAELGRPASARKLSHLGLRVRAVGNRLPVDVFGYVNSAACPCIGQVLVGAGAIVDVCNNCSALVSSAVLELGRNRLCMSRE